MAVYQLALLFLSGVLLTSTVERLSITFTSNGKREFVPRGQVFHQLGRASWRKATRCEEQPQEEKTSVILNQNYD